MSVILLDPRFPAMIPVEAVSHLRGDVSYTEEVPVRVRWVIADLGGHTVAESDVLVTTDITNDAVRERLNNHEEIIKAPSLVVEMEPNKQLESGSSATAEGDRVSPNAADGAGNTATMPSPEAVAGRVAGGAGGASGAASVTHSGAGFVDGEIVGTDEHTVAVAGLRRTTRTEVPASVMDEIEDAVALMARALRQGEWEQSMTHTSLMEFLRQETAELARVVEAVDEHSDEDAGTAAPQWLEQELCQELSDVLLQVLFHAEIANRRGAFDIGHVSGAFVAKMRSRAPYLFEQVERDVPRTEQDRLWEEGKRRERAAKLERLGEPYRAFLKDKDAPAQPNQGSAAGATAGNTAKPATGTATNSATTSAAGTVTKPATTPAAGTVTKPAAGSTAKPATTSAAGTVTKPATTPAAGTAPESTQADQAVASSQSGQANVSSKPSQFSAKPDQTAASSQSNSAEQAAPATVQSPPVSSALVEAENVIRRAREMGLPDSKIPTDIRFPMVGLELDEPGESDRRLLDAVRAFQQQLDDRGA
ncbi:MazG nucleotide pyrophosphohydrolase domain-containing protein [Corynebacterium auriscanis]|uniref:MazG nucleotide pyrophosphohydrolase domain-containing protein n=1 Tax=Corynebacterium auriscanis TaxID=99807 RepID=UPI002AFFBAA6|nr:MazG nucleotide pyrophosphohydrolase domain-containing protein [Corynebacterium auriscanis]